MPPKTPLSAASCSTRTSWAAISPRTSTSSLAATPPASAVKIRPRFSASGRPGLTSSCTAPPCTLTASGTNSPDRASRTDLATWVPAFSCASCGAGAQVRGGDHGRERQQRAVGARLGGEHVDAGPGHPAVLERHRQRVLVHDAAPGGVDDPHAGLDEPQFPVPDQAHGLGVAGQVHADEVGLGQQLIQADHAHAELGRARGGHVGVIGDHLHAERGQPLGDQHPDPAQPEDPGHLAGTARHR